MATEHPPNSNSEAIEPTQIFSNDLLMIGRSGRLFRIHPEYVAVDNHTPLTIPSKEWKQLVCDHLRWGASNIVGQMGLSPDHVVCFSDRRSAEQAQGAGRAAELGGP